MEEVSRLSEISIGDKTHFPIDIKISSRATLKLPRNAILPILVQWAVKVKQDQPGNPVSHPLHSKRALQ